MGASAKVAFLPLLVDRDGICRPHRGARRAEEKGGERTRQKLDCTTMDATPNTSVVGLADRRTGFCHDADVVANHHSPVVWPLPLWDAVRCAWL